MAAYNHLAMTEFTFEFPGMKCYLESIEGTTFLDTLSMKYNCKFQFSLKDKKPKVTLDKKCLSYETFVCHGFNFHIVRGFFKDIQCQLTIQFMPSNQELCYAEASHSSLYLIHLPPWRIHKDQQISHLQLLRTSLSESIKSVLDVAQQYQSQTVVFSTEKISEAEYPFPLDAIAHAVVNSLRQSYQQSVNPRVWISWAPDIYLCEPTREAVFKAFSFVLNKYSPILCRGIDENMCLKGPPKCHGRETESHNYSKKLSKKGKELKEKVYNVVYKFAASKLQNLETNYKPKSYESCTPTRIKKITMKIYSQSVQDNEKSVADFKNNLDQLMRENTQELTVNEQQTTKLEKMMRNAEELPVHYSLEETTHFGVEQRKSRGSRKQERNVSYREGFKGSLLKVSGLQKKSVSEFINMVIGPSQMKSSSVTTCFDEDGRKTQEKKEHNSSLSALTRECQEYFFWMIETQQNSEGKIDFEPHAYSDKLEECYRKKEERTKLDTTEEIDFQTMTIDSKKRVIRTVDTKCATNYPVPPDVWEISTKFSYRLKRVSNDDKEFRNIETLLKDNIKQCEIKQIKRVENLQLWESYQCKKHMTKSSDVIMWHRILASCQSLVGHYGLHKHFSAMPQQAQALGDSVLLVLSPTDCLTQNDIIEADVIHLVLARVIHEEKEQFCKSLSPLDGVQGAHMIFNNAEAYPCHIVAIRLKQETFPKQHL